MGISGIFTVLLTIGGLAATSYLVEGNLKQTLDAFSSAAALEPIDARTDELRIWRRDYMTGHVLGYAISQNSAARCIAKSSYEDGAITIGKAKCRRIRIRIEDIDGLGAVAALSGKQWDCPMFDGEAVYIEGAHAGTQFALRVGNPSACEAAESQAIVRLLRQLK